VPVTFFVTFLGWNMPRPHRIFFPGALYHVTSRGNNKENIFKNRADHQYYFEVLAEAKKLFPFKLYSYALMPNHMHLLIETVGPDLGKIMKFVNYRYTIFFNKKYSRSGHLFGSRYYCKIIQKDKYFSSVLRYIHLNPVKAGLSKSLNCSWSSYGAYILKPDKSIVDYKSALELLGDCDMFAKKKFAALHICDFDEKLWKKFESPRNCVVGDKKFKNYLKKVPVTF